MTIRQVKTQEGKTLVEYHNTRKWASAKRGSTNEFPWCMSTKKWMMNNSPKEEWWLKRRELVEHKRTKQRGKIKIIDFLTCEAFRRWFFQRWCLKHLRCPSTTSPN
jgi:hypothetical protein